MGWSSEAPLLDPLPPSPASLLLFPISHPGEELLYLQFPGFLFHFPSSSFLQCPLCGTPFSHSFPSPSMCPGWPRVLPTLQCWTQAQFLQWKFPHHPRRVRSNLLRPVYLDCILQFTEQRWLVGGIKMKWGYIFQSLPSAMFCQIPISHCLTTSALDSRTFQVLAANKVSPLSFKMISKFFIFPSFSARWNGDPFLGLLLLRWVGAVTESADVGDLHYGTHPLSLSVLLLGWGNGGREDQDTEKMGIGGRDGHEWPPFVVSREPGLSRLSLSPSNCAMISVYIL